jgi:hypothetical protein
MLQYNVSGEINVQNCGVEDVFQIELINLASRAGGIHSPMPIQVIGNVEKTIIT